MQDLFAYVDDLSSKLSDADAELQDKRDAIRVVRDQVEQGKSEIQALKHEKVSLSAIPLLILSLLSPPVEIRFADFSRRLDTLLLWL